MVKKNIFLANKFYLKYGGDVYVKYVAKQVIAWERRVTNRRIEAKNIDRRETEAGERKYGAIVQLSSVGP
jgi:hypothetical protein